MIRILLQYILPIALPSLLYVAWLAYENRRIARGGAGRPPRWQEGPWPWLIAGGVVFAVLLSFALANIGGYGTGGTYVPPRVEDGRIIPGHVEPARPKQ